MVEGFCLAAVIFYIILCFYATKVSKEIHRRVKAVIEIDTKRCLCPKEFPKERDILKKLGFDVDPCFHSSVFTAEKKMDFSDLAEWKKSLAQLNFVRYVSVKRK